MALFNFNATQVEPAQSNFEPIPAGNYIAHIIHSELKDTRAGNGKRLELQFQILEGEFKNRIIFEGLNIQNASPQAEQIAQQQLSAICHAIGILQIQDSVQLHHKPIQIKVKIRKDEQYGDRNEISQYAALKPTGGISAPSAMKPPVAPPQAAPTMPTYQQPQATAPVQPWNR